MGYGTHGREPLTLGKIKIIQIECCPICNTKLNIFNYLGDEEQRIPTYKCPKCGWEKWRK